MQSDSRIIRCSCGVQVELNENQFPFRCICGVTINLDGSIIKGLQSHNGLCYFTRNQDGINYICIYCDRISTTADKRICMQRRIRHDNKGVGTYLTSWFTSLGIKAHAGCPCKSLAAEMDRAGIDAVEKNFGEYVDKLYNSASKWRQGKKFFPQPPKFVLKAVLYWAIKSARQQHGLELKIPETEEEFEISSTNI